MSKPAALGIDIGGTKTLCVLVNKRCEISEAVALGAANLVLEHWRAGK